MMLNITTKIQNSKQVVMLEYQNTKVILQEAILQTGLSLCDQESENYRAIDI